MKCEICGEETKGYSKYCRSCSQKLANTKRKDTMIKRYGVDNPMKSDRFISKIRNTMERRYGVNCAMKVPKFKQKYQDTMIEKYGVPYYVISDDYVNHGNISEINKKFGESLQSHGYDIEYEFKLDDKLYDIHIIGTNSLIEVNSSYTHNVIGNHWNPNGIPENYHINKTAVASQHGYRCIHVWDWDNWDNIISLIQADTKLYARQCQVKHVGIKELKVFLDCNHLQQHVRGTEFALGLYYNDELVQVMSWGKPRFNKHFDYELLRLCSKVGYKIVGGAERLMKHSLDLLQDSSLISYCDLAKFSGDVYERLGFTLYRMNAPQEIWSKENKRILGTTLRSKGYDLLFNTNYGKGTSNEELMIKDGWLPVYDCGQAVFTYNYSKQDTQESPKSDTKGMIDNYKDIANTIVKSKIRHCAFCGKEFIPKSNRQKYCEGPHIRICPVCGKEYEETNNENLNKPPHACSYKCRAAKTKQTSLERYGIPTPGNTDKAREKARNTMMDRYGAPYTLQSNQLRDKVGKTNMTKYGDVNANSSKARENRNK